MEKDESRGAEGRGVVPVASVASGAPAPGRTTLTEQLAVSVQRAALAGGAPPADDDRVHRAAADGVAGAGGALPHMDAIQRSFGPDHDVAGIDAHVGGAAATASAAIGASAYATGTSVAFAQSPDLHTAAHEAAHVVQQRRGVQLKGGVGAAGDVYEQHADAVADRVVAGESAADLLSVSAGVAPAGGITRGVQRSPPDPNAADAEKPAADAGGGGDAPAQSAIRGSAAGVLAGVPAPLDSKTNHDDFIKYTGTSQEVMEKDWKGGGHMTACNGFTGWYGGAMGMTGLGVFDLASAAPGAFVTPGEGRFPKTGDIVKMKIFHVCVTVSCAGEGGTWVVLEAGQGGPAHGSDLLMKHTKTYNPGDVQGWIDIEKWSNPAVRARASTIKQIHGKWEAKVGDDVWTYTFPKDSATVSYVLKSDPTNKGTGTWNKDSDGQNITITWDSGTVEKWPAHGVQVNSGKGTLSNNGDGVSFRRLWV